MPPRVVTFYHSDLGTFHVPQGHRFRPYRAHLARSLLDALGVRVETVVPPLASKADLGQFHADVLLNVLEVTDHMLETQSEPQIQAQLSRLNLSTDASSSCPIFPGMFFFCRMYVTGSVGGAYILNAKAASTVINWFGGAARAKKAWASDGCLVNDAVLAVLELLKAHERVLYVSMDFAHPAGVEEAFYTTNRVLSLSFHREMQFGPGLEDDDGFARGKGYTVNVPLGQGVDDALYVPIFTNVVRAAAAAYKPDAVVFVASPSVLAGDRHGDFALSSEGHAACVRVVHELGLPLLVLGGLSSNAVHAARVWATATAILSDAGPLDAARVPADHPCALFVEGAHALAVPTCTVPRDADLPDKVAALEQRALARLAGLRAANSAAAPSAPAAASAADLPKLT